MLKHSQRHTNMESKIFTIVELLIVLAIIAVLAAMLLPALNKASERAKSIGCTNNLKQIGNAVSFYTIDYDGYLISCALPETGWWIYSLKRQLNYNSDADILTKGVTQCPSRTKEDAIWGSLGYGWNYDYFGYRYNSPGVGYGTKIHRVPDPQTILIADSKDVGDTQVLIYPASPLMENRIAARHLNGGNYLFIDGHVEYITRQDILNIRDVPHIGTSKSWANYGPMINHRFTPAKD